jgi:hypothetical protein
VTRTKLIRVRPDHVLELMDLEGAPYIEVRPGYTEMMGPVIHFYRVGISSQAEYLLTLRLPSVNELVRKLPIVIAAARRLQNGATVSPPPAKARTPGK